MSGGPLLSNSGVIGMVEASDELSYHLDVSVVQSVLDSIHSHSEEEIKTRLMSLGVFDDAVEGSDFYTYTNDCARTKQ